MKKRLLSLLLCALMVVSTVPVTPLIDLVSVQVSAANIETLQAVFNKVPARSEWSKYIDTSALEVAYDYAITILENPEGIPQERIDSCAANLQKAINNLKLHTQGITLNKSTHSAAVGQTFTLRAILDPTDAADPVEWKSSDTKVASVTKEGIVTVNKYSKNKVTLTATSNGHSASCILTVLNPLGGVKISKTSAELFKGRNLNLTAEAYGKDSQYAPTGNVFYTWSTDNEAVATVTDTGSVTAVAPGSCNITVTATDKTDIYTAKCKITVNKLTPVTSLQPITITTSDILVMTAGETTTFRVTVLPSNASIKDLNWKSADSSIVSISEAESSSSGIASAKIKANKAGKVKITYTTTDGSKLSGSFTVEVRPLISSLALSPTSKVISVDSEGEKFTVTIKPENAGNQVLSWSSDNPDVCEVNYNGTLVPHKAGTCNISAATSDGSNIVVSGKLRVAEKAASVVISRGTLTLNTKDTHTLSATVTTLDGYSYSDVKWSSSDTSVATVNQKGVVTAKHPGSAVIKATTLDGTDKNAVCIVTVNQPVKGVSLPESRTIYVGKYTTLSPTFKPEYATNQKVTWKSSNTSVATVDSKGKVTGKKEGTAKITVTTADGGYTASCTVKVMIQTTGVTLNRKDAKLNKGAKLTLVPTVLPSNATNKEVTWKSSNTAVATVSKNGVVTAVAGGTCTITVTTNNSSKTATCKITVVEKVTGVKLSKSKLSLYKGQEYALSATVIPKTATNKAVTWKSSKTSVVRVSSSGVLTAVSTGSATISVKTADGGYVAYCDVTVLKKVPVKGLTLDVKSKSIDVDEYFTFMATITPSNASEKSLTWKSSNTSIVTVDKNGRMKGISPGTAIISATTVDGGYQAQCKVTVIQPVIGVRINVSSVTLALGKSKTLVANVLPSDATNKKVTWTSSDPKVITVTSKGVVTAKKAGSATVTATTVDGGYTSNCSFTVYVPVTGVKISVKNVELPKGETRLITASVLPSSASNQGITWKSSNTSIATVNEAGQITAKSKGTCNITATSKDGGYSSICVVTVLQLASSVRLNFSSITLDVGKTKTLTATLTPSTVTYRTVNWKSSNKEIAKVSSKGVITALKAGTAIITCTSKDGNAKTTCKITVTQPATGITLSENKISVREGKLKAITATVKPADTTNSKITWTSSNSKVATVDSSGVIKGIQKGTATITARTVSSGKTAKCTVTVIKSVTGMSLNKTSMTIDVGRRSVITPLIKPASASIKTVTWSSSNYDIADVTKDGQVIAKAPGYAKITAKTKDGGYKASCDVLVIQPVKGVKLNKSTLLVEAGEKYTLKPTVNPSNASNKNVKWSSSDTKIIKVNSSGVVTGLKSGTATITVKTVSGGFTAKCTVKVVKKVTGITLNKTSAKLYLDGKITLNAKVAPSDATVKDITWKSSNTKVAKVSSNGVVTPVAPGNVTISCTTKDGGFVAKCTVTVKREATKITLNKSSISVNVGKTVTLKPTVSPSNTTDKTVTWKSSNTKVAKVSSKGVITGVSRGTATITATTENGLSKTCKVTVKQPVTGVDISKNVASVYTGEKLTLSSTVFPSNANNKAVTYHSANTSIAKVSSKGVVTGVKAGTTKITVKTADGGYTAECKLTVLQRVTSIAFEKAAISMRKGDEIQLKVTVSPSDATNKNYTFVSSDPETIFVSSTGEIIAKKGGEATVTVKSNDNNKTADCLITVIEPVTSVALDKEEHTLYVGKSFTLGVIVSPSDANNKTVKWTSSDPSIATVSSKGVVKAMKSGTTTIMVTTNDGDYTDFCKITCLQKPESVVLNHTAATVNVGGTLALKATVLPKDSYNKEITWKSDNENIAVVDNGVVTAINPGKANITVTTVKGGKTALCEITVHQPVQKVELNKSEITLNKGESTKIAATVYPSNASNQNITWLTSDKSVADVTNGKIIAVGKGTAYISAKTEDGDFTALCLVTVRQRPESIKFSKKEYSVATNEKVQLSWSVLPKTSNDKTVTLVSDNKKVATIDNKGLVTGLKAGTANITVKANDGGVTATVPVKVIQKAETLSVKGEKTTVWVGGNASFSAEVLPADTTDKSVVWSSSNEKIATVDSEGKITAHKAGSCDIIATSIYGTAENKITVTVLQQITGVKLSRTEKAMKIDESFTLTATVLPADAYNSNVSWKSSDSNTVSVDSNGVVKAHKLGTVTITAYSADKNIKAVCQVRVIKLVDSITFVRNTVNIEKGNSITLTTVIHPEDATEKQLTWTSSDKSIVSVDKNGKVKGLKGGTATVRATTTTDGVYAECLITVDVKSTGLTLDNSKISVYCNKTKKLNATFTPDDTTNKKIKWISSDNKIATVENGIVKGIAPGVAVITAKAEDTGIKATCTVTVKRHVSSVELEYGELTLEKGKSKVLAATVLPEDSTNKSLVWSTANSTIATVKEGKITAVGTGTTTVTVKTVDGNFTDSCTVKVIQKPTEIVLSNTKLTLVEETSKNLSVKFLPDDVTEKDILWSSSDSKVATVDGKGKVKAVSKGIAEIIAKSKANEEVFAKCIVTVTRAVKGIDMAQDKLTTYKGRELSLKVAFTPSDATNKKLTWKTSDKSVATVTNGVVSAKDKGTAIITAHSDDGGYVAYCFVTVLIGIDSVKFDKTKIMIGKNESTKIKATILPDNASVKTLIWKSEDESIVTVKNGTVTAGNKAGKTTITATAADNATAFAKCEITVKEPVTEINLNETKLDLRKKNTYQLNAIITPSDATIKDITWKSTDEKVATVDKTGKVTAISEGTANIVCTSTDSGKTAICEVKVLREIENLTVSLPAISLGTKASLALKITAKPTSHDENFSFASSNEDVLTVSKKGVVTGKGPGTATVTVISDVSGKKATCTITVIQSVEAISFTSGTTAEAYTGLSHKLSYTVSPSNATNKTVRWLTSDESIATVDNNGLITYHSAGEVYITVQSVESEVYSQCKVTVKQSPEEIYINLGSVELRTGKEIQLEAEITPVNSFDKSINWSSDNTSVAKVDKNGKVKAVSAGTAIITARTFNGIEAYCSVTVK